MSRRTCSTGLPECFEMVSSSHARMRSISSATIWMSEACPCMPSIAGWWMRTRALGSARRLPGEPAASSTAAAEAAWPRHTVWICGLMYCIVS